MTRISRVLTVLSVLIATGGNISTILRSFYLESVHGHSFDGVYSVFKNAINARLSSADRSIPNS
jgi:hypothetical protein